MVRQSAHLYPERQGSAEREPKRRRVRKGTQSCWECKRRKVRCTFAAPSNTTCDGCRRRGSSCIGQEFPNEASAAEKIKDRLGRVEELLERLAGESGRASGSMEVSQAEATANPATSRTRTVTPESSPKETSRYHHLSNRLASSWPSQQDLGVILNLPINVEGFLELATVTLHSSSPGPVGKSPRDILCLPPPGSHPVLFARKSLLLALYLQGARRFPSQEYDHGRNGLSASSRDTIMARLLKTSHDLVTSNDDLVSCIEGVECLTFEAIFHNHAGSLRRAWLAQRRAMLVAQTMGLHRGFASPALLKVAEPDARGRINATHLWFRLVQMDRYLSVILGLPLGYADNDFAEPEALEGCTPKERMQRLQCAAAGRIVQRNQADIDDLASTYEIDTQLHEASSLVPPRCWLLGGTDEDAGTAPERINVMDVFTQHYLLVRLHLPYLLRSSEDRMYDYSKIAAVNASRDIVSWFVNFRWSSALPSSCRGADFLAFIASTTLCIAHLEARHQRRKLGAGQGNAGAGAVFSYLVHQRPADRSVLERTLVVLQTMAEDGTDKISCNISRILKHLLDIEQDAATGGTYHTGTKSVYGDCSDGADGLGCDGKVSDGGNVLGIYIPYFGTIKIERSGVSKLDLTASEASAPESTPFLGGSPGGYQVEDELANPDWQDVAPHVSNTSGLSPSAVDNQDLPGFSDIGDAYSGQFLVPGLESVGDDWALQGVDMAFFDSLLRGGTNNTYIEGCDLS